MPDPDPIVRVPRSPFPVPRSFHSVVVPVVQVLAVLMLVRDRLVLVRMAVRTGGHRIVGVSVVAVVVGVNVLVAERRVLVPVVGGARRRAARRRRS
jgi:hypothetical protein